MADKLSFSAGTKEEISRVYPQKDCCRLAELAALLRMDGTVTVGAGGKTGFYISTEYPAAARKVYRLLKDCFGLEGQLTVKRQKRLKKRILYDIRVPAGEAALQALGRLGILGENRQIHPEIGRELVRTQCCRQSYLRGAFLGGGSVSSPDGNYHLEIVTGHLRQALDLAALINRFQGMRAKVSSRRDRQTVYLKDSDQIAQFLALIGAHSSLLEFERIRVMKELKNRIRRRVNCEAANLDKTVEAAGRQTANIRFLQRELGLENLETPLRDLALRRLENPEMNLKELGQLLLPPVGKSGVNHRMRRLEELAEEIRQKKIRPSGSGRPD